jgi:Transposase DDE domain group 1
MLTKPFASAQNGAFNLVALVGGAQVQIQSTTKAVTPFAGLASFFAWLRQIGLPGQVEAAMPFSYSSPNAIPLTHTFLAFLTSVVAGAARFAHSGWLRSDSALHALMGVDRFPGDDSIRRFFHRFTQAGVEAFWRPLWRWQLAMLAPPAGGFTLDLDSTIFQRGGAQEGAAKGYNPKRPGRLSHHPLLAVLAEAPCVLHAWLRSGNTTAGRGVVAFLAEALALLPEGWKLRCLRADCFAPPHGAHRCAAA